MYVCIGVMCMLAECMRIYHDGFLYVFACFRMFMVYNMCLCSFCFTGDVNNSPFTVNICNVCMCVCSQYVSVKVSNVHFYVFVLLSCIMYMCRDNVDLHLV